MGYNLLINGVYFTTHLLTIDPNFLGHPSSQMGRLRDTWRMGSQDLDAVIVFVPEMGLWDPFLTWPLYGLYMVVTNYLLTGMILQVPHWSLTAKASKSYRNPIGKVCLPTTIFHGRAVKLWGCIEIPLVVNKNFHNPQYHPAFITNQCGFNLSFTGSMKHIYRTYCTTIHD